MRANVRQSAVILTALALLSLSELFPPWLYEDGWTSEKRHAGYHLVNSMPSRKPIGELRHVFTLPDEGPARDVSVGVDAARLYGQRLTLIFFATGLFLLLGDRRTFHRLALGGLSLLVGLAFSALLVWHVSLPRWY